jgi:hypothetical protein
MDIFDKLRLPTDQSRWERMCVLHELLPLPSDVVNYIGLYDILAIKKFSKDDTRLSIYRPDMAFSYYLYDSVRCCIKFSNKYHMLFLFVEQNKLIYEFFNTKCGSVSRKIIK